jgi:hypothetical protein
MTEPRSVRLALATISACAAAGALYAALRVIQKILFREPDPALVIWSAHAGYFWRAWTAAYVGGMIGFITYIAAGRSTARTARVLATFVVISTVIITAQGLLVP